MSIKVISYLIIGIISVSCVFGHITNTGSYAKCAYSKLSNDAIIAYLLLAKGANDGRY